MFDLCKMQNKRWFLFGAAATRFLDKYSEQSSLISKLPQMMTACLALSKFDGLGGETDLFSHSADFWTWLGQHTSQFTGNFVDREAVEERGSLHTTTARQQTQPGSPVDFREMFLHVQAS